MTMNFKKNQNNAVCSMDCKNCPNGCLLYTSTGRRKSSVARVHLFPNGTGSITVNGRSIDEYFRCV